MFFKSIKICKIELNFYLYLFPNKYKHYIIMNKAKVILNHIQSTSKFKSIYKLINPQLKVLKLIILMTWTSQEF